MKKMILYSGFFALLMGFSAYGSALQSEVKTNELIEGCREIECNFVAIPSKFTNFVDDQEINASIESSLKPHGTNVNKASDNTQPTLSLNWSGYAALTNIQNPKNYSVQEASGSWIVPTVASTGLIDSYSAAWVGIDGYFTTSQTVQQIGTAQNWINSAPQYYAWFEMFPQESFLIGGFPVNPGDKISAEVKYIQNSENIFLLTIANKTKKVFARIAKSYTVQPIAVRTSAEWIIEAPSSSLTGDILPLANYGTIHFFDCSATIRSKDGAINSKHWENAAITMVNGAGDVISQPSKLHHKGFSFDITRENISELN